MPEWRKQGTFFTPTLDGNIFAAYGGYDPAEFTLVAFGGAAGLHAAALAESWPGRPIRFVVPFPPGGTVVEYTAGTTGISLAMVAAALGYRAHFVFSDAFSDEKRWTMRAAGRSSRASGDAISGWIATCAGIAPKNGITRP